MLTFYYKKTFEYIFYTATVTVKEGAPACNHMKYGCQMQNNFPYKDDEYLR